MNAVRSKPSRPSLPGRLSWSNGLTAIRLVSVVPLVCAIRLEAWAIACVVFWLAVLTDLADGRVARARDEVSTFGGVFDHATDAIFVSSGLFVLAFNDQAPWMLAPLVGVAFLQYFFDSKALAGQALRSSAVGRWNGILYFVPIGIVVTREALGLSSPTNGHIAYFGWVLVATTSVSITDRAIAFLAMRRKPPL